MTHDELKDLIDKFDCAGMVYEPSTAALRSVVELHKPNLKGGCDICSYLVNGFVLYEICPTIQAIKKELPNAG